MSTHRLTRARHDAGRPGQPALYAAVFARPDTDREPGGVPYVIPPGCHYGALIDPPAGMSTGGQARLYTTRAAAEAHLEEYREAGGYGAAQIDAGTLLVLQVERVNGEVWREATWSAEGGDHE